jgi:integrase
MERRYVGTESRAKDVDGADLSRITDPYTRLSLRLQREFGLRREESIKFTPRYADHGDHLLLKPSWTKGGKARQIPILNESQRQLVDEVAAFAGSASLIPADKSFIQQLRIYKCQVMNAGLNRMHGLRHQYAQRRFREITGFDCPHAGGPTRTALTSAQRELDQRARREISRELGHEREQIVSVYVGR